MKKIVGLYGRDNVGKSRTLYLFAKLLISNGAKFLRSEDVDIDFFNDNPTKKKGPACDFRAVFTLNGKNIGITTWGDNIYELEVNIQFLENGIECDFVFAATRTSKATPKALGEFADKHHAKMVWIRQKYLDDFSAEMQESGNRERAFVLFQEIE